jgi:hypothetical protein
MVGQELNPVCTPSRFGKRSVVFENIEEALILKVKMLDTNFDYELYLPFSLQ